ncbi:cubilin-like [Haliotis rufescens]|uniref:cubilin-like n=1 Tax=Haliotis rufescens TaxID=6454 RepID=UPI00201EB1EB|nr:cubilin-like [Haliotis rufescens]XP_048244913.1 cubilin-like [Haliotis rufescens]
MYVPGMICFTLVVSLLLAQTEGRAFNNVQSRERRQTSGCDGGTRYDYFGPISTNIGGEYGNNENCCWNIVPDVQGTWAITFQFSSFDVESSSGCRYDALTFDTDDGPVKECGQKTDFSRTFVVNGSQFEVCFSSDGSVTGQGVSGTYSIGTVNVDSTSNPAYTTAYPDYTTSYPDYTTSYPYYSTAYPYYSTAYPYYSTAYPYYSTAYPDYSTAYPDYSTAYPDYSTAYPDYAIYYSDYTTSYPDYATDYPDYATAYPDYVTAYPDYITAYPEYTTAYPEYPQEPVTTSGNTSYYGNHGSISINADGNYENSQDNCYSLHPSFTGSGVITFVFNVFDIEEATGCVFDYIEFDGINKKLRECGTVDAGTQREFEFHDGRFNVCFHSDGSVTGRGVQATYSMNPVRRIESVETTPYPVDVTFNATMSTNFTEATTLPVSITVNATSLPDTEDNTCTQVLTSDDGALTSPGNGSYANNVQCVTVITGPSVPYTLVLSFTTFDLEYSSTCRYDYLEVDMGEGNSQKGCGSSWDNRTVEYSSDGGNVTLTFSSDSSQTGTGYIATYTIQPRGVPSLSDGDCLYINTNVSAGVIQSLPGTGSDYTNNMDCTYEFTRNTPFYLDINFIALDTESSSNCRYDYVQVGDDKYCGSDLPNATRVSVQGGSAIIRFRSDSSVTGKGFVALFTIEEHCNSEIDDLEGTYTLATDSEDHYKNNQHCDITLRSPPAPHITTVNFTRFDIEDDSGCDYDSLTITSDDGAEKLCGAKESFIRQYTGPVDMTFTSDGSVVRSGFSFSYVTEIVYCNATINAPSGTFESLPGGYENNMYCTYTINTPTPGDLVFTFPLFDVESGSSCRYDAVEMAGDKLCGTNIQDKTYSTDGHFQFLFTSDGSVTKDGFRIDFNFTPADNITTSPLPTLPTLPVTTQTTTLPVTTSSPDTDTCTQVLTSDDGTLTSPGNGSYANNVQCVTVITGPSVPYTLVLSFTTFDLEGSSTCRYDYLEVDMGEGNSQKGCGSTWDNRTVEYTSDGGNVTVTFSSDSSQTGAGYSATYTILPRGVPSLSDGDCLYINSNVTAGVIQSLPGTGSDYTNNMDCSYEFTRNTPFYLDINFIALDTESSSDCRYDYVQVGDDKYCGSDLPNATRVSAQGGSAIIRFRSDSSVTGKGFVALFTIEEHCNFDSEDLEGTYTLATDSEDHYRNNQHCEITLRSPPTPHITTVNFTRFDIEDDSGCDYDSLTITSDDATEKLCGAKESFIRQYTGPTVDMAFTSDGSVVRSGFAFNYVTELVYCNATINATSGTFESQPGGYESNMYCTYTINTPTPGDLVFTFPLFDVESGRSCRYDAVEMEGDKLCGTNIQEKTYSTDGHFQFVFTSDGSVNGEGFKIDFTFIPHEIQN